MRRAEIAVLAFLLCGCYETFRFSGSELTKLNGLQEHSVQLVTRDGRPYEFDLSQEIQFGFSDGHEGTARFVDIRILDSSHVFWGQLPGGRIVKFPIASVSSFVIERVPRGAHLLARAGGIALLLGGLIFIIVVFP